jgi:hypothetical protein
LPEGLRPQVRKKPRTARVTVTPIGNGFRIVRVEP